MKLFSFISKKNLAQNILYLVDSLVWLGIKIFPGIVILKILQIRPWKVFRVILMQYNFDQIAFSLKNLLKIFIYKNKRFSYCLSKVATSRIILDIFGIENIINIGINKFSNGDKIPHAVIRIIGFKNLDFSDSEFVYLGPLDKVLLTI